MKTLSRCTLAVVVALVATFSVATAHEGERHESETVLGTVKSVRTDKVEIETPDGKTVTVALAADTEYTRDGEDSTKDAIEPGMRVAMEVTGDDHGGMVCHRMKLGAMMEHEHHGKDPGHDPHRH